MNPILEQEFKALISRHGAIDNELFTNREELFCVPKSNVESVRYRREGNLYFRRTNIKDYIKSLRLYNQSICFAANDSEELSMAYANRAAVYLTIKEYQLCLDNIELARKNGAVSDDLARKLLNREERCRSIAAEYPRTEMPSGASTSSAASYPIEPKLVYPPHPTVPFITNCLEFKRDEKYGRHVRTNRDLKVGDIVAVEDPFCVIVPIAKLYERCECCFSENSFSLIPCKGCTAVMYCNQKCADAAYHQYHQFECNVIDYIHRKFPDRLDLIPMRITLRALTAFPSLTEFMAFFDEAKDRDNNVFNITHSADMGPREIYGPIYSMQRAMWGILAEHPIHYQKLLSILFAMMKRTLLYTFTTVDSMHVLVDLIKHHMLISAVNSSATWDMADDSGTDPETIVTGLFPFRSLLSHSCAPNIWTTAYGSKVIISVLRPIEAGEQLFDSYGCCHVGDPIEVRREELTFSCDCIACIEDWPMGCDLANGPISQVPVDKDPKILIDIFDRSVVSPNFNRIVQYIQENDSHYPCKQLITAQNIYAHLLDLMYGIEIPLCVRFNPPHAFFGH